MQNADEIQTETWHFQTIGRLIRDNRKLKTLVYTTARTPHRNASTNLMLK